MSFFKQQLSNFYSDKSILSANKIVNWKKTQKIYNFKKLPNTAILTPTTSLFSGFQKYFKKKLTGLSGKNYILNSSYLVSFNFGNGAPAIVSQLEELRALGVTHFIFIGFAGILAPQLKENTAFIINKAYSISGTSYFYSKNELIEPKSNLLTTLKSTLQLQEKTCLSTDAPFRETTELLTRFVEKNAVLIDMETAAVFAFSDFYNINCCSILVASDRIENNEWHPPKNMINLVKTIDTIIRKISTI